MKRKLFLLIFTFIIGNHYAQDTFSIVAVDPETGEVGSAGASCVDLNQLSGVTDHFLGELFPGVGAINTQAYYDAGNQANARNRMNAGDTPSEIITWLKNNDVQYFPSYRQYGIVALVNGNPEAAAYTGEATQNYKGHIVGQNYAIQGNILKGEEVLQAMERGFLNTEGNLACKLMGAMQGANMVGADARCQANGTSSLFAYIKVAAPNDVFGSPSFLLSTRTSMGDNVEPIDTLQTLFETAQSCTTLGLHDNVKIQEEFFLYPNPVRDKLKIHSDNLSGCTIRIINELGVILYDYKSELGKTSIDVSRLSKGVYFIQLNSKKGSFTKKIIKK